MSKNIDYQCTLPVLCNKYCMDKRKTCANCRKNPVAINYYKDGIVHYRSKCVRCTRYKIKTSPPGWIKSGYKKKEKCERCGFKFKYTEQSRVYSLDGNVDNADWFNLKTICLLCQVEVQHSTLPWKANKLSPDF